MITFISIAVIFISIYFISDAIKSQRQKRRDLQELQRLFLILQQMERQRLFQQQEFQRRRFQQQQQKNFLLSKYSNTLGITSSQALNLPLSDIKSNYRKLALKYHPDCGGSNEKFRELTEAFQFICKIKEK
jgi:DnaJ domain